MIPRIAPFLLLMACAEYDVKAGDLNGAMDTADADDATESLRIDVYPNSSGPDLEPQSLLVDDGDDWSKLRFSLSRPVEVEGTITGYEANPGLAADVPGEEVPVIASISVSRANDIAGGSTTSDADGRFDLELTGGTDFLISIVPIDPSLLPFLVLTDQDLGDDRRFDDDELALGYGEPVYGQVTDSEGKPVTDCYIGLIDPATGLAGPTVQPSAEGWYQLRAFPGDYILQVTGDTGDTVPTSQTSLAVVDGEGASLNLDLGKLDPVNIKGQLLDPDGNEVNDATVRFTSTRLEQEGASLVIETNPDRTGEFLEELLPGSWTVEFIPSIETDLSPVSTTVEIGTTTVSMQDVVLPRMVDVVSVVLDPSGEELAGVVVTATEVGFNGRSWSAVSDATGVLSLRVPSTPVRLTLTPPSPSAAITRLDADPNVDDLSTLTLVLGVEVSGQVELDGEAIPYTVLELRDPETEELLGSTFTDDLGYFSVRVQR